MRVPGRFWLFFWGSFELSGFLGNGRHLNRGERFPRVGGIGGEAPDGSEAKRMPCLLLDRHGCWVRPCVEGEALGIQGRACGPW